MGRKQADYRRLPGRRGFSLGTVHRLYAGSDHLLLLTTTGFSETYKRFYYRDIEAVIVTKTGRGALQNLFLALPSCIFFVAWWAGRWESVGFFVTALVFLSLLLVNTLRGPTCNAYMQTAIQFVRLPSLARLRPARKAVALLSSRIGEAQGTLPDVPPIPPGGVPADRPVPPIPPIPAAARRQGAHPAPAPVRRDSGLAHAALFGILLAAGIESIVDFRVHALPLTLFSYVLMAATTLLLVYALIRQRGSDVSPGMRRAVYATAAYWVAGLCVGYAVSLSVMLKQPQIMRTQWDMIRHFSSLAPEDSPLLFYAGLFDIAAPLAIGALGLAAFARFRRARSLPPPPADRAA